ncbi:unnamed protein product [Lampetra planeri]
MRPATAMNAKRLNVWICVCSCRSFSLVMADGAALASRGASGQAMASRAASAAAASLPGFADAAGVGAALSAAAVSQAHAGGRRGEAGGHPGSASGSSRRGVLKSGWLKKQGGFVRSWHARWFVLRGEQLCYYKDEDENKILGSLFLPGSRVLERPPTPDDPNKYLLEILSGGERAGGSAESTVLMASSQSDMEEWARALRRVIWAPLGGGVFGQRLEETVRWERQHCGHATVPPGAPAGLPPAPRVVQQCVSFIRERGLAEEGLFRMPGQASLVRDLQRAFDCGERPSFDGSTDVHTVASLLKLYLRELPEPVVPFSAYGDFLACAKLLNAKPEQGFLELSCRLQVLPPANYSLLRYICSFLDEVQSHAVVNKMSIQNLATVFGPNILRPKTEDPASIMEGAPLIQQLMEVFIAEQHRLFPRPCVDVHVSRLPPGSLGRPEGLRKDAREGPPPLLSGGGGTASCGPPAGGGRPSAWGALPLSESDTCTSGSEPGAAVVFRGRSVGAGGAGCRPLPAVADPLGSPRAAAARRGTAAPFGKGAVANGSLGAAVGGCGEAPYRAGPGRPLTGGRETGSPRSGGGGPRFGPVPPPPTSRRVASDTLECSSRLWAANGYATIREHNRRPPGPERAGGCRGGLGAGCVGGGVGGSATLQRISTYDNVPAESPSAGNSEERRSVDSGATWSSSSCEISLGDVAASACGSTPACSFRDCGYGEPRGGRAEPRGALPAQLEGLVERVEVCVRSSVTTTTTSRINEPTLLPLALPLAPPLAPPPLPLVGGPCGGAGPGGAGPLGCDPDESHHEAMQELVVELKMELSRQKAEYEQRIKSLEASGVDACRRAERLSEELEQERARHRMAEIRQRNAERARQDAEARNRVLQREMEHFFASFSDTGQPESAQMPKRRGHPQPR